MTSTPYRQISGYFKVHIPPVPTREPSSYGLTSPPLSLSSLIPSSSISFSLTHILRQTKSKLASHLEALNPGSPLPGCNFFPKSLPGAEAKGLASPFPSLVSAERCGEHGEVLSMFCLDNLEPLCYQCGIDVSHAGHRVYSLTEAATDCKVGIRHQVLQPRLQNVWFALDTFHTWQWRVY